MCSGGGGIVRAEPCKHAWVHTCHKCSCACAVNPLQPGLACTGAWARLSPCGHPRSPLGAAAPREAAGLARGRGLARITAWGGIGTLSSVWGQPWVGVRTLSSAWGQLRPRTGQPLSSTTCKPGARPSCCSTAQGLGGPWVAEGASEGLGLPPSVGGRREEEPRPHR